MRRATTHREAASREWSKWLTDYEPYGPWLYVDDDGNGTLSIRQFSPVPPVIAIELGEWLYNLRAALDYTAYALAIYSSKLDPPPNERTLQFPIYESAESFRKHKSCIKPLSDKHRAWIEAMQPYAYGANPEQTAIYWVNHLSRIDRHRKLQVVGAYVTESDPIVRFDPAKDARTERAIFFEDVDPFVFIEQGDDGEGEAVVARFKILPPSARDEVHANAQTAIEPDILEMARQRPTEVRWLFFPLAKRFLVMEAMIDADIGLFENDCFGWTRSKFFKKKGAVDPTGVKVRGSDAAHDSPPA